MMLRRLSFLAAATVAVIAAAPASAVVVTGVRINNSGAAGSQSFLQVAELQAFSGLTNVAATGTATASSVYSNVFGGPDTSADRAIDGLTAGLYGVDNFYHSVTADTSEFLRVDFGGAFTLNRLTIFGRSDPCCSFRDSYTYSLLNGDTVVGTGSLDASGGSRIATAALPEPATWAMMVGGVGFVGGAMRRRNTRTRVRFA